MKPNRLFVSLVPILILTSSLLVPPVAAKAPVVTWKISWLEPSRSYATSSIASTNSPGAKVWSVSGSCTLKAGRVKTKSYGHCSVTVKIKAKGNFKSKTSWKRFVLTNLSFTNRTTANGLGSNTVYGVYAVDSKVYAATTGGLSISTDNGATFVNRTTANGLGSNTVNGLMVNGWVYAATDGGLSFSSDDGATFFNYTKANGLATDKVWGVSEHRGFLYAATDEALSSCTYCTDDSWWWENKTWEDGLGDSRVYWVGRNENGNGSKVYALTSSFFNISKNYGDLFKSRNDLGVNYFAAYVLYGPDDSSDTVYVGTDMGLSVSTDGGVTFTFNEPANGLGSWNVYGVYATDSKVYAATESGLSISN